MSRSSRRALLLAMTVVVTACTAEPSTSQTPSPAAPTPTVEPATTEPSATASLSPASPTATAAQPLSLDLPETTDPRVISASVTPDIGAEGGSLTVVVSSAASERIDEIVLRWPAELEATLRLAPFVPSDDRINDGAPPLNQPWTKWVVGPGEQGEPAGTISLGWGPLLPGATLTIPIFVTRIAAGPVAFDLQLLARNDVLTFEGGAAAELRVQVP